MASESADSLALSLMRASLPSLKHSWFVLSPTGRPSLPLRKLKPQSVCFWLWVIMCVPEGWACLTWCHSSLRNTKRTHTNPNTLPAWPIWQFPRHTYKPPSGELDSQGFSAFWNASWTYFFFNRPPLSWYQKSLWSLDQDQILGMISEATWFD